MRDRYLRQLLCVLTGLCLAVPSNAAPVRATTVDGNSIAGEFAGIDAQGRPQIRTGDGGMQALDRADLIGLFFPAAQSQPAATSQPADQVDVFLADLSTFGARIASSNANSIELQTTAIPRLKLDLSQVAAIRFSRRDVPAASKVFIEALDPRNPTQDTLFVVQEAKVSPLRGIVESVDDRGVSFKWRERSMRIERDRAYGVVFAKGAGKTFVPQVRCTLADGSVWAGDLAGGDAQAIKLQLAAGADVQVPVVQVAAIQFRNDRVRFLSDLDPSKYTFTPWGSTQWPYRKDRSVAGQPLRIHGQEFDRGIGMHSKAELVYTLSEPYQQFAATVGLDEAVGTRGNVVFRVLADGKELFNSGPVGGQEAGRPVLVALNGARTLQLVVDFGEDLDIADQADWGAARLIK